MQIRVLRGMALLLLMASLGLLACDMGTLLGAAGSKPTVTIQAPATGSIYHEGEEVTVQSTSQDSSGIVRVELAVDGTAVRSDAPPIPQGQAQFTLVQKWPATPGTHTLSVRAFNASGAGSDPALVAITVAPASASGSTPPSSTSIPVGPGGPEATSTPTPLGGLVLPTVPGAATVDTSVTPTRRPTATRVPPTATVLAAPPGVYATSIRVDPADPKRGTAPTFVVTFLNTTGKVQQYRWFIKIYEPDKPNSKGETSKLANDFPAGTTELRSPADWTVGRAGPCESFFARVFWYNRDSNETTEFIKPDGSGGPAANFQMCP